MSLFETTQLVGTSVYFIYFLFFSWLSQIPRTRPGAGWWAAAVFCAFLSRLSFIISGAFDFNALQQESIYSLFVFVEKYFLLVGMCRFFELEKPIQILQTLFGAALLWVVMANYLPLTIPSYALGVALFNSYVLFHLSFVAIRYRKQVPKNMMILTACFSVILGVHWLTYPFLRFNIAWTTPGFFIGTLLMALLYLSLIGTFLLIFQQRLIEAEHKALNMAYHDPLTGLNNQRYLKTLFEQALLLATRPHQFLAVIYIDLDNFKPINDTAGHQTGDEVLKIIAQRLTEHTRKTDICARIGGDEFVILATQLDDEDQVHQIAQKLLFHLTQPLTTQTGQYQVGASIGVSLYPSHGNNLSELMALADAAMYAVKKSGKSNYRIFDKRSISA